MSLVKENSFSLTKDSIVGARQNHCNGECDFLSKEASVESIAYFDDLDPKKGYVYLLVVAMTAGEYYGPNRNGDYFLEQDLITYHKIFESAGVFWNHDNKDKSKSSGQVLRSFWNNVMHRIELVIEVAESKARFIPDHIKRGIPIKVSMGLTTPCLVAGTRVTMDNGLSRPIESIVAGDRVLTSQGNMKRVLKTTKTEHQDKSLAIVSPNVGNKVVSTLNHKFHVVDFRKAGYSTTAKRFKDIMKLLQDCPDVESLKEWVEAVDLDPEKHLLTCAVQERGDRYNSEKINVFTARLLGYYLAEGHIEYSTRRDGSNKKAAGIALSCHVDDNAIRELDDIMKGIPVPYLSYRVEERSDCDKLRVIRIRGEEIANLAIEICGTYSKHKKLSRDVFLWNDELKKNFLGAYLDGDGHFDKRKNNGHYGHLKLSTASVVLAEQAQSLLDSLGIQSSRNRLNHKPTGMSKKNTISYEVVIGKHSAQEFYGYCSKVQKIDIDPSLSSPRKKFLDNNSFTLIKSVDIVDSNDVDQHDGYVYDIVVEDDHSFVAERSNVHNSEHCSYCGHVTRGSYANRCEHLKFMMNQNLRNGKKVYAISGTPYKIFDISIISGRQADKTAFSMMTKTHKGD